MHRKLSNDFWIVGTNSKKYIDNFIKLSCSLVEDKSLIINNLSLVSSSNEVIFKCNAKSTFQQNLIAWEAFGFIQRNKEFINILVRSLDDEIYYEIAKIFLLIPSSSKIINRYKDSIVLCLLNKLNIDVINLFGLNQIRYKETLNNKKINKCFGSFEKFCLSDDGFSNLLLQWWCKHQYSEVKKC